MKIRLYRKKFTCNSAWKVYQGDGLDSHDIHGFMELSLLLNWHWIFCFSMEVNNKSFNYRNPFKAYCKALESESIGMCKYQQLKERVRDVGCWGKL